MGQTKSLSEQMKENKRVINKAIREMDRERMALEREQKKLESEIKKMVSAIFIVSFIVLFFLFYLSSVSVDYF